MRNRILLLAALASYLAGADALCQEHRFRLENDYVSFQFDTVSFGLTGITDKATGARHVNVEAGAAMLWQIDFQRGASTTSISNKSAKPASSLETLPDGSQVLSLTWDKISWWRDDDFAKVQVTITLPENSGIAEWRIDVDNRNDLWGLWGVKFPYVKGFLKPGEYDVAIPGGNGGINYRKLAGPVAKRYPSGPWPAQFLCGTTGSDSFYMAALDPDSRVKEFMIKPGTDFYINVFPENMGVAGSDAPDRFPLPLAFIRATGKKHANCTVHGL